ncbi:unnamed protein product [Meganyctiphanes norvegica]|uniref:Uncharacterized protein n=1 Tax=Meganyctiphanes norvegica TaxID=48144 RepID=A0AAV2S2Q9_MEGNR
MSRHLLSTSWLKLKVFIIRMQCLLLTVLVAMAALVHGQQDRINLRTKMCAPLSLAECEQVAQVCLDLSIALREPFSSSTSAISCGSQYGIGFFALLWARSSAKTNDEILRDAGADAETARAITRCVLTNIGYANNNVLDVGKIKQTIRPIISQTVRKPNQQAATLAAIDSCQQPTIDTMRTYVLCISETCIKAR